MYKPSKAVLEKYAKVLVDFALWGGKGLKEKEVVNLEFDQPATPLALAVYKRILEKGAYPITKIAEEDFSKVFFENASEDQLKFFPKKLRKSLVDTIDHRIYLIARRDPLLLKDVDPKKFVVVKEAVKPYREWLDAKEDKGKLTWTLCLYGTPGLAKEAGLSQKEYWRQIERACFLNHQDPISKWKQVIKKIEQTKKKLDDLKIEKIHVKGNRTDLWITMGEKRKWIGGSGRNIPSFEIFTSPDWRGTEGKIYFDLPLYRNGNVMKGIYLEFRKGLVVKAVAKQNSKMIKSIIKTKNANKIGEFSLTDKRFSKIDKFMASTLYDENYGGKYGNTHLALGKSYHDAYAGDSKRINKEGWKRMGFNDSPEHCDIMQKQNRVVTAVLKGGKKKIIYKDGRFTL